jgi:hypothetical protein
MQYIFAVLIGLAFGVFSLFAQDFKVNPGFDAKAGSPFADYPGLLMKKEREAAFRWAMPTIVGHDNDWHGLYYTSDDHPPMHQVNGGVWIANSPAFEFPWKSPGGTDSMDQTKHYTWKVLQLPAGGKVTTFVNGRIWDWTFPVGTRFVEAFSYPDQLKVFELRQRTKRANGTWETKRYFPAKDESLVMSQQTWGVSDKVHTFPAFPAMSLAVDQVRAGGRDFTELVESKWAPTSSVRDAIVPLNYHGFFAIRNCNNCHDSAGKEAREFSGSRYNNGERVRGSLSEGILSFTPRGERLAPIVGGLGALR